MPLTGGFAGLLLATLPGFFIFCRSSMSEIIASALVVFAFMFAYLGLKEERRWKIYVSAAFLGLSLNIRIQSLFFTRLLLVMAFFPERGSRLRWLLHCAALPILFLLAASPGLALNTIEFHSPFKTVTTSGSLWRQSVLVGNKTCRLRPDCCPADFRWRKGTAVLD